MFMRGEIQHKNPWLIDLDTGPISTSTISTFPQAAMKFSSNVCGAANPARQHAFLLLFVEISAPAGDPSSLECGAIFPGKFTEATERISGTIFSGAFSPDGQRVATASATRR